MVRGRALAISEDARELEEARLAGHQQLLHRDLGRGVQPERAGPPSRLRQLRGEGGDMHLHAGGHLKRRRLDLDETLPVEPVPHAPQQRRALEQCRAAGGVSLGAPPRFFLPGQRLPPFRDRAGMDARGLSG